MIDLYTWPTPNGHKIHIMLEETGLAYRVHPVDIGAAEQFKRKKVRAQRRAAQTTPPTESAA